MFVGAKFVEVSLPEVFRKWFRIIVKSIVVMTRQFLCSFGNLPEDASVITARGNSDTKKRIARKLSRIEFLRHCWLAVNH